MLKSKAIAVTDAWKQLRFYGEFYVSAATGASALFDWGSKLHFKDFIFASGKWAGRVKHFGAAGFFIPESCHNKLLLKEVQICNLQLRRLKKVNGKYSIWGTIKQQKEA